MDIQQIMSMVSESNMLERKNYHLTLGELIDFLKTSSLSHKLSPKIVGIGAYRGYYSDIALMTDSVLSDDLYFRDEIDTIHKLADRLESMVGKYTEGYKGGAYEITLDKPLWLAKDYSDHSRIAVIGIDGDCNLLTKEIK